MINTLQFILPVVRSNCGIVTCVVVILFTVGYPPPPDSCDESGTNLSPFFSKIQPFYQIKRFEEGAFFVFFRFSVDTFLELDISSMCRGSVWDYLIWLKSIN